MVEFKQIVCPVDFSETSLRALAYAAALARWYDARLIVLHVAPTFESMQVQGDLGEPARVMTPMPREQVLEEMRRSLKLDAVSAGAIPIAESGDPQVRTLVAEESRAWVEIDDAVVFGRAHREILRAAETTPPDLIAIGAQGKGGIGLALFGSTTQEVVRGAMCPVLTVHGVRQS